MEQLVACKAHNLEVGGSSPPPATSTMQLTVNLKLDSLRLKV